MAGESYTWIDSASTSHPMDGSGNTLVLGYGPVGLYMPPTAQLNQRTPLQPGSNWKYTDIQDRILTLPVLVFATSETLLRTQLRSMIDTWFAAPGTLRATAPDGTTQRDLNSAYYFAGLDIDETDNSKRGPGWVEAPLQLWAPDPFWYDTAATTAGPYTNTQMGAGVTIANGGAYACDATWTLHGPFTNLVITNTTSGYKMDISANGGLTLGNTDSLVIDTKAGTITLNGTTSEMSHLSTASVLFQLLTGNNAITFTYTGGLNGTTTATVSYKQRYRSV